MSLENRTHFYFPQSSASNKKETFSVSFVDVVKPSGTGPVPW